MIFDISFESNIAAAMKFIGYYLYDIKIKEFKQSLRAQNLFKLLQQKASPLEVADA